LQALEAAEISREFYLETAYELARLYEQRREYRQAAYFYQVVLGAPRPRRHAAAVEAQRKAEAAEVRLLLLESRRSLQRVLYAGAGGIAFLFVLFGVGFLFLRRQHKAPRQSLVVQKARGGVYIIPRNLPTGLSLSDLKDRFQQALEAERVGRCMAYAYAALLDPALVLPYLDDAWLADHVEADSLPNNRALLQCVIAIETAVEAQTFGKNPENTMLKLFQREFAKRGWDYPTHPTEWKQHFIEHHLDMLFERS